MSMRAHDGVETKGEVNVIVLVDITETGSLRFRDKKRIWLVTAEVTGNTERHKRPGLLQSSARFRSTFFVDLDLFSQSGVHDKTFGFRAEARRPPPAE